MLAYIARRLLLMVPTLFGIMVVNFIVVQAAPGGPVELMIARIKGQAAEATARVGGSATGATAAPQMPGAGRGGAGGRPRRGRGARRRAAMGAARTGPPAGSIPS